MIMSKEQAIVRVEDLFKWFPIKGGVLGRTVGHVKAVDGVSFVVNPGETLGIVGESGCGKTTLGRACMRLTKPTRGTVYFEGQEITGLRRGKLKNIRRKMQIVFQDPYASLDPRQTVGSALTEPMKIHHLGASSKDRKERARILIAKVGLNPDHLARFPHEFSGGQRQRIAVARVLAVEPTFVVLDEPTSSLDVSVQSQILNLLKNLQGEFGLTYLFISHNLAVVRQVCHRVAVMYLGRIVEIADTEELFNNPRHPYTEALLTSVPIPDPKRRKDLAVLEGDVPSPVDIPSGCRFRARCPYATQKCEKEDPPDVEVRPGHWAECHYNIDFSKKEVVSEVRS
ncbi:MAG: ATP-binding cassette domain-containing protein [Thaumarchaeota archaeon]|nr:ATP-binding cassette domain-containing protein [Nitrososphaerota archaeon]